MMFDKEKKTHPAYGMIGFRRIHGGEGKVFFGSSVPAPTYIELCIYPAGFRHELGQDWYSVSSLTPHVRVSLTNSQFAELLTTMNVGDGVPCTVESVAGVKAEKIEKVEKESERIRTDFSDRTKVAFNKIKEKIDHIQTLLSKDKVAKKDRETVMKVLRDIEQEFQSNIPFYLQQFEEASEKVSVQYKAEVDAFITHMIHRTGLSSLKLLKSSPENLEKLPKEEKSE